MSTFQNVHFVFKEKLVTFMKNSLLLVST